MDLESRDKELSEPLRQAQERTDQLNGQANERLEPYGERTFAEFLVACHEHISIPLSIRYKEARLPAKGTIPDPVGHFCPTFLEPWDFRTAQQSLFNQVYEFFHPLQSPAVQVFPSIPIIKDRGQKACQYALGSKLHIQKFQEHEVEIPIRDIIKYLATIPTAQAAFSLSDGIMFKNNLATPTEQPGVKPVSNTEAVKRYQNRTFHDVNGERRLIYVTESIPGHKLTDAYLHAGLHPMNMYQDVVRRNTIPTAGDERQQYNAEQLTCIAMTQIFDYMIKQGLEYSCLSNGNIRVMLRVPFDRPKTLQYCLLDPSKDGACFSRTAVASYLGLTLLALDTTTRNQAWRNNARQVVEKWEAPGSCEGTGTDEGGKGQPPSSLVKTNQCREIQPTSTNTRPSGSTSQTHSQNHRYCTQKCLQGVFLQSPLDPRCPNIDLHTEYSHDGLHPISHSELVSLMETQVNEDPDCCHPLNIEGLHGALFALTLKGYGYTFIGKGTIYNSEYEANIYRKLKRLQGVTIPVYLGDVYFRQSVYFLRADYIIIHMSMMAWGGQCLDDIDTPIEQYTETYAGQIERARKELLAAGIEHLDFGPRNMLWNEEVQRVMIIDFGRVRIRDEPPKRKTKTRWWSRLLRSEWRLEY
ncbi:hypothetical protein FQN57_006157 [Myotisia sp. PD_48]|nr:hypothetical protein FQN57_006157 [Myotisia sp. PD_48]